VLRYIDGGGYLAVEETAGILLSGEPVRIVLEGGPSDIPETTWVQKVLPDHHKIKIAHRGGYEHFELASKSSGPDEPTLVIFRWTMRTKIAE
jgi:hypothetical protein